MMTASKTDVDTKLTVNSQEKPITPDTRLIAQCVAGNLDAFGQVYASYSDAVFRHAFYLTGHHEDADDIKQETFLRAYRALHTFRRDSSLLTWLLRICGNLCYDRLKHRQKRGEISFDPQKAQHYLPHVSGNDPHSILDRADTLQILMRVLQAMPLPQRSVIVLHIVEGLDYKQIGQILGCAPTTAKMRVLRATHQYKARVTAIIKDEG